MFRSSRLILACLVLLGCSAAQTPPVRCSAPAAVPVTTRVVEQVDQSADNTVLLEPFQPRCPTTSPSARSTRHVTAIRFRAAGRIGYRLGVSDRVGASPQAQHSCYLIGQGEEVTAYFDTLYRPEAVVIVPQNPSSGHVISEIDAVVLPREVMIGGERVATRVYCHDFYDMTACEHTVHSTTN